MNIEEAFALVQTDIDKVEAGFKTNLNSQVPLIKKVGEYILSSGGKRYRPLMLLLSARLCSYKPDETNKHIELAQVVEFLHTATLLHDDVVDNADLRRGETSANRVWGNGASVLCGDYLLSKAFHMAVKSRHLEILNVLSSATTSMAEGEVLQLINHNDIDTTEASHLQVITNKTAVLFDAACRVAGILAEASKEKLNALSTYGMDLGIAYQLIDDCLDYTSTNEDLGKPIGNDLTEGKVTLPLIEAYKNGSNDEKKIIKDAIESPEVTKATLEEVITIINKYKGIDITMKKAQDRIDSAKKVLEVFDPSPERDAAVAVADYVISRTH